MASAREQIISEGGEPTLGDVVQMAAKTRPDLPEPALWRVAAEILASQPGCSGGKVREAIHEEIVKRLRIDPQVKKAMEQTFALVLNEFRAVTLDDSPALESVRRQVHGVTGGHMREFAQRLRDAIPRPLTEEMILVWADTHHAQTGNWPRVLSGSVIGEPNETWANVNRALEKGLRGLTGDSSIAQLLEKHRGASNVNFPLPLNEEQILGWADAHFEKTGKWPGQDSGTIDDAPDENWANINAALRLGLRELPGNSSLAKFLAEKRGTRNPSNLLPLTDKQILEWVDKYYSCKGEWPTRCSGRVDSAVGETWSGINHALTVGSRGLSGCSSLAKLLSDHRGVRNIQDLPHLSIEQVLAWADEHQKRTGKWPTSASGPVIMAPGETWMGIHRTLQKGRRGLPGNSSLAEFLREHRGKRNHMKVMPLTAEQILWWADSHLQGTGQYPTRKSDLVAEAPEETWGAIDGALRIGNRGFKGGSSLARFLAKHRKVRNKKDLPPLTVEQILSWADAHYRRSGTWPAQGTGSVEDAPAETWGAIDASLKVGRRGFSGGSSLAKLLKRSGRVAYDRKTKV
jgi:hypothetical protein